MVLQKKDQDSEDKFGKIVDLKTERKLRARREAGESIWNWLGMMGLVGWSVALPTVIGVLIGRWLDKKYPSPFSWTLTLMLAGLALGCITAWRWVKGESRWR